jgi:hypothetical protein
MTPALRTALEALRKPQRPAWEATTAEQYAVPAWNAAIDAALALLAPTPGETAPDHTDGWCSGCGLRWKGDLSCTELCGDCWRKVQPILHAAPPPAEAPLDADAAYAEECRQADAWYRERAIATALHERDTLAAQQWQPIETAPKDGSVVWTWTDRQSDRLRALIWARPNLRPQLAKQWVSPVAKCAPTYYPTHWMPLPDPPRALQPTPPETP